MVVVVVVVVYDCAQSGSRRWSSNRSHMRHGERKIRHQSSQATKDHATRKWLVKADREVKT